MTTATLDAQARRAIDFRETVRLSFPAATVRTRGAELTKDGRPSAIQAVINTADVDRYATIIDPRGGDFTHYLENPILLWQHGLDQSIGSWPVGRTLKINTGDTEIVAELEFDTEGALGKELDRLYRDKWLRGFSIGFLPRDYRLEQIGTESIIRYTAWELAELSCVAVPGNPNALARTVEWDADWRIGDECQVASPAQRRAMAAVADVRGGVNRAHYVHHHADGRLSWRALAECMAELLTQPSDLSAFQRDAAYQHLAAHYRELGVMPPEPGAKSPEEAYTLALEGRVALLDSQGQAWLFVEPVANAGRTVPGFQRIDDSRALRLGHTPANGAMADYRRWGCRETITR